MLWSCKLKQTGCAEALAARRSWKTFLVLSWLAVAGTLWASGPAPALARAPALDATAESSRLRFEQRVIDLNSSAVEQEKLHDYKSAVALLEEARALWSASAGLLPAMHSALLGNLADAYEHEGSWREAARVLEEAIALDGRYFGAADPRTWQMHVRLGEAEVMLGDLAVADSRLHLALDQLRTLAAGDDAQLALALASVAVVDVNVGRTAEAEALASEALRLQEHSGCGDRECASIMGVLAGVYVIEAKHARAQPLLTRSIDILERTSRDDVRLAPLLVQRGLIEGSDHKYSLARADIERAIQILDCGDISGINGDSARLHLGSVYLAEHKVAEAEDIIPATVERQRRLLGTPSRRLATCIRQLARLRALQKRYPEAASLYREAIGMVDAGPGHSTERPRAAGEKDVRALERTASEMLDSARDGR